MPELSPKTLVKLSAIDAKMAGNQAMRDMFARDPQKFLADFEFTPEEIAAVKAAGGQPVRACTKLKNGWTVGPTVNPATKACSCCAVAWSSCGTGCAPRPVGGHSVGG